MKNEEINFKVDINDELKNLISSCLEHKVEERAKIEDIMSHRVF